MQRNNVISIAKGIAIILMVAGHAEAPWYVTNFIYTFHMPLFFMAAGYCFNRYYVDEPWTFISRRVKGLYFPFLKWSILFLLLHNVWHHFGILNEQFGNLSGGVTHPYTLREALARLLMMVTGMSGYDEFMAGAFWFFRGLLVASLVFFLIHRYMDTHVRSRTDVAVLLICLAMVALTALRIAFNLKISVIPNGGWRETWGIFFFGAGVIYRLDEYRIPKSGWLAGLCLLFLMFAGYMRFSGMNNGAKYQDLITLPLTGIAGFIAVNYLSSLIARRESPLQRLLIFIGNNTLYVFVFHIISFKAVSLLKIWWYDLPFEQIGCHMVIHDYHGDLFWILYTIAGVALPLLWLRAWRALRPRRRPSPSASLQAR